LVTQAIAKNGFGNQFAPGSWMRNVVDKSSHLAKHWARSLFNFLLILENVLAAPQAYFVFL